MQSTVAIMLRLCVAPLLFVLCFFVYFPLIVGFLLFIFDGWFDGFKDSFYINVTVIIHSFYC